MEKIAVDVMGADYSPNEEIFGAIQAVREFHIPVVLVGNKDEILPVLKEEGEEANPLIEIHHASQVIEMDDHPTKAFLQKKDASVTVGAELVSKGECGALVAAGSTGAAVTAGLLKIGRIRGMERPAILTPLPNEKKGITYLIDSGASSNPKVTTYLQNAMLGYTYAKSVAHIEHPRIGLLNIGAEHTKGSQLVTEAYNLLSSQKSIPFAGNAEGLDIVSGKFDVIVTDGFTGNVVLKFGESTGHFFGNLLKDTIRKGGIQARIGALLLRPALKKYFVKVVDSAERGGAPLLGLRGGLVICHGASKAKAIKNAIHQAELMSTGHLPDVVAKTLRQLEAEQQSVNKE